MNIRDFGKMKGVMRQNRTNRQDHHIKIFLDLPTRRRSRTNNELLVGCLQPAGAASNQSNASSNSLPKDEITLFVRGTQICIKNGHLDIIIQPPDRQCQTRCLCAAGRRTGHMI